MTCNVFNKSFSCKLIFFLIFLIVFISVMTSIMTIEAEAFAAAVPVFLSIAKYAGGAALTVGGAYAIYKMWESSADSELVQQLKTIQSFGSTGFKMVSLALYNSIYNFVNDFLGNGRHNVPVETENDFNGFRLGRNILPGLPSEGTKYYLTNNTIDGPRVWYYSINQGQESCWINIGSVGYKHYFIFGPPELDIIWDGAQFHMYLHYYGSDGNRNFGKYSIPTEYNSDMFQAGYVIVQPAFEVNGSHSISVDMPFWQGKTVEDSGEQKLLVPPIPAQWLEGSPAVPMPESYINNPAIDFDFNPDTDAAEDVWEGDVAPPVSTPIDLSGILDAILSIPQKIIDLLRDLLSFFFTVPDDVSLDFSPLSDLSLTNKFPFSLPWDLKNSFNMLTAPPVPPRWEIPILTETLVIDFAQFENLALISRSFLSIIFVVVLIILTRRFIGGA